MVRNFVDDLCVYNDRIEHNQIGDKQPDLGPFVEDIENRLLSKWNFAQAKFHDERVSYGFSTMPCPRVLRTSIAQATI